MFWREGRSWRGRRGLIIRASRPPFIRTTPPHVTPVIVCVIYERATLSQTAATLVLCERVWSLVWAAQRKSADWRYCAGRRDDGGCRLPLRETRPTVHACRIDSTHRFICVAFTGLSDVCYDEDESTFHVNLVLANWIIWTVCFSSQFVVIFRVFIWVLFTFFYYQTLSTEIDTVKPYRQYFYALLLYCFETELK